MIGARYYDEVVGRFVSVDPVMDLSDPQQWHGYAYANNNPTSFSDPTGLLRNHSHDGSVRTADRRVSKPPTRYPVVRRSSAPAATPPARQSAGRWIGNTIGSARWAPEFYRHYLTGIWDGGVAMAVQGTKWTGAGLLTQAITGGSYDDLQAYFQAGDPGDGSFASGKWMYHVGFWVPEIALAAATGGTSAAGSAVRGGARTASAPIGRTAARSCLRSFAGATLVLMADGSKKPIQDIAVGERVVATDPETGERVRREVTHVWVHEDQVFGLRVGEESILVTEDHPVWSVTRGHFAPAGELAPGEVVLGDGGRELTVTGLELGPSLTVTAYNLSVRDVHTYHVGDADVVVHNDCSDEAWDIANHAFDGHGADMGFRTIEEMGTYIDDVIQRGAGHLRDDGSRFWVDYERSAIVFRGASRANARDGLPA